VTMSGRVQGGRFFLSKCSRWQESVCHKSEHDTRNIMSKRINPCHAVALAFVVYYLIVPPMATGGYFRAHRTYADPTAPLPKWYYYNEQPASNMDRAHAKNFSSRTECEAERKSRYLAWLTWKHPPPYWIQFGLDTATEEASHAMCVSSDDPRLEVK
jgi:hypothetical protein